VSKVKKWLESKAKEPAARYDETKKEFEKIIGKPCITITVELPESLDEFRTEFLSLEKDEKFLEAVKKLVELHLKEEQTKKRQADTSETS
jgi:exonuclease VII small subunit